MPKLFVFVHGYKGTSESQFIPKMKEFCIKNNHRAVSTSYPNADQPDFDEWKKHFENHIKQEWQGEEIVLVAHSLGGFFILRLLSESAECPWLSKVIGAVTVGGTTLTRPERRSFYSVPINWEILRSLPIRYTVIYSEDDAFVSSDHPNLAKSELSSTPDFKYILVSGHNHFQEADPAPVRDALSSYF